MTMILQQEVQPSWSVHSAPRVRETRVQAAVWGLCQGLKVCRNKSWLLVSTSLWYPFFFFNCNNAPHSRMTVAILSLSWVRLYFWKVSEALPRSKYIDMGRTKTSLWTWRDFLLRRLTFFWMTYSITAGIFFLILLFEVRSKDPVKHSKSVVWKGVLRLIWTHRKIAFLPNTIKTLEP